MIEYIAPAHWFRALAGTPKLSRRRAYDAAASTWHLCISRLGYLRAYTDFISFVMARHPIKFGGKPLRILDAGTGSGGFAQAFAAQADRPIELVLHDISASMLAEAKANLTIESVSISLVCGDFDALSGHHGIYDVILCSHVIEQTDSPLANLAKLHRLLKPGGVLLLVLSKPHWCTWLVRMRWGHKAYRPESAQRILAAVTFEDITVFPFKYGPPRRMSCGYYCFKSLPKSAHTPGKDPGK